MKPLLILSCLLLLNACSSSEKAKTVADSPTYTLIFMDKSVSVNANRTFINQKYQQAINDLVEQNIKRKGDKLAVYFIHENTAKARALTLTTRSEMDDVSSASPTDREAAQTAFDLALQREKAVFKRQIDAKLAQQNTAPSNQKTDIWASLPVIAEAAESGAAVAVYYLSDMIESASGPGRRDFGKQPPSGQAQASEWAKIDAEQLKQYAIGSPAITMILPFEPTSSVKENNPAITHYWQTLFGELGATQVEEQ